MTGAAVVTEHRVTLRDGRVATIRPLVAGDADELVRSYAAADPWDLRRRFMGSPPPASWLVERLRAADGTHDFALGAFTPSGRLIAVAQFDRGDDEASAEVAIEVAKGWQHDGLGIVLLEQLAQAAREAGIRELTATFYADNFAIRRLLRDVAPVIDAGYAAGEGYMRLDLTKLPAPRTEDSGAAQSP